MLSRLAVAAVLVSVPAVAPAAISFVGKYEVAASATDLSGQTSDGAQNRLSFGSDWVFSNDRFYGITDRGPGGGVLPFVPRIRAAEIRRLLEDKAFPIDAMSATLGVQPIPLDEGLARTFR